MKIGILGVGFVGGTHLRAFQIAGIDIITHDIKYKDSRLDNLLVCDLIFVALPSPTINGSQDLSIIERAMRELSEFNYRGVLCIKSTVLPGTTSKLRNRFGLRITHSPEFLRERTAFGDFLSQTTVLIGGNECDTSIVSDAYQAQRFGAGLSPLTIMKFNDPAITEMAKYMHNSFLALKVAWANQFSLSCEMYGINYSDVREAACSQGGIGFGHLAVPGPDMKVGYSGTCFPKDVRALIKMFPNMTILESAENFNQKIRPHDEFCNPQT